MTKGIFWSGCPSPIDTSPSDCWKWGEFPAILIGNSMGEFNCDVTMEGGELTMPPKFKNSNSNPSSSSYSQRMNHKPPPFKGRSEMETLLGSSQSKDWEFVVEMFLGKSSREGFRFVPKHVSNAWGWLISVWNFFFIIFYSIFSCTKHNKNQTNLVIILIGRDSVIHDRKVVVK